MIARDSIEAFLAAPVGAYVVGPCFLVWSYSARLAGSIIWGEPSESEVRRIIALWDFGRELPIDAAGLDVITDGHALKRLDGTSYDLVIAYVRERAPEFAARYRRQAIVLDPLGVTGAAIAGIFP